MADQKVNISAVNDAGPVLKEFAQILYDQNIRFKENVNTLLEFNKAGALARVSAKGLTEENEKLRIVTRATDQGLKLQNITLDQNRKVIDAAAEAEKRLAALKAQNEKVFTKQEQDRIAAGNKILANLKQQQIAEQQRATTAARTALTQTAIPGALEGIGFDPSKFNTAQVGAARIAINNLASSMIAGRVSAKDLELAVTAVNTKSLIPLAGGAGIAATQLNNLAAIGTSSGIQVGITWQAAFRLFEVFIARQVLIGILNQFKQAAQEVLKFDTELTKIKVASDLSNDALDKLRNTIQFLGAEFRKSDAEVAAAALVIYQNRVASAQDRTELLDNALKLSKITFTTVDEAAKTLTDTINLYNLKITDQERITKLLFATQKEGRATLKDLDNLFEKTGVDATKLGLKIEDIATAFVVLRDKNIKATDAIQIISSTLDKFLRPSKDFQAFLTNAGLGSAELALKSGGLITVLAKINEEAKKGAPEAVKFAGGIRELKGELALGIDAKKFEEVTNRILESEHKVDEAAAAVDAARSARLEQLKNDYTRFFQAIANDWLDLGVTIDDALRKAFGHQRVEIKLNTDVTNEELVKQRDANFKTIDEVKKAYENFFNSVRANLENVKGTLRETTKQAVEVLEISSKGAIDVQQERVTELKRQITEAQNAIKESQKAIFNDAEKFERESFERRLKLQSPNEQFKNIQGRIGTLQAQGADLFGGTPEQVREGRIKFDEVAALIIRQIDLNNQQQRVQARQQTQAEQVLITQARQIRSAIDGEERHKQAQNARLNETIAHERVLAELRKNGANQQLKDQETLRHGQELIRISERPDKVSDIEEKTAERTLEIFQQQTNQLRNRAPFLTLNERLENNLLILLSKKNELEAQSQVNRLREKKDLEAQVDAEKARLRLLEQSFKDLISFNPFDAKGGLKDKSSSLANEAEKLNAILKKTIDVIPQEAITRNPQILFDVLKTYQAKYAALDIQSKENAINREEEFVNKQIDSATKLTEAQIGNFQKRNVQLQKSAAASADIINTGLEHSAPLPFLGGTDVHNLEAFQKVRQDLNDFSAASNKTNLNKLREDFDAFKARIDSFGGGGAKARVEIENLNKTINDLGTNLNKIDPNTGKIRQLGEELKKIQVPEIVAPLGDAAKNANNLDTNIRGFNSNIVIARDRANELNDALNKAANNAGRINLGAGAGIPGKAAGGPINFGPSGIDKVPIMATRGEFVVNAESTKAFYSQLVAINSARGYNAGGQVTNVGDIHVTVQGGDSSEITVREIGRQLQRQIRRGTISFD